jgi:hypothetical protein
MLKPESDFDQGPQKNSLTQGDPSFEKLMQLVFSRPIYLEPPDEPESENEKDENEETESEAGGEAQPQ